MGNEVTVCEACGGQVDPDAPGIVKAVEMEEARDSDGVEVLEGQGVVFHAGCYPGGRRYRRRRE